MFVEQTPFDEQSFPCTVVVGSTEYSVDRPVWTILSAATPFASNNLRPPTQRYLLC